MRIYNSITLSLHTHTRTRTHTHIHTHTYTRTPHTYHALRAQFFGRIDRLGAVDALVGGPDGRRTFDGRVGVGVLVEEEVGTFGHLDGWGGRMVGWCFKKDGGEIGRGGEGREKRMEE